MFNVLIVFVVVLMILIVTGISMNSKVNWQLCRCVSTAWCNHSINNYTNPETIMAMMMMMLVVSANSDGGDDGREHWCLSIHEYHQTGRSKNYSDTQTRSLVRMMEMF